MLTELQKRKLLHTFDLWDCNGNGYIEQADYVVVADRLAQTRGWAKGSPEDAHAQAMYAAGWQFMEQFADVDHNKQVKRDEWLTCFDSLFQNPDAYQQLIVGTAEFNFAVADVDGDGAWTLDEYRLYLQTLNAPTDHAAAVFHQTDATGTGHMTKATLTQLLNEYFLSDDPAAVGNLLLGAY